MQELGVKPQHFSLRDLGIEDGRAYWNLTPDELIAHSLRLKQAVETSSGAIAVNTGEFTGRSPKDKFIVKDDLTANTIWWNNFNIPFNPEDFDKLYLKLIQYLNGREFFVRDAYACADPRFQLKLRVINELPWSNLFAHHLFIRPKSSELTTFTPDWYILNCPGFQANPATDGTRQHNFSIVDFKRKMILIGGSAYTGEIKKGIFTVLNYLLPQQHNVFPMHCSANLGKDGDTALFFGLSGTGKTTLSADPHRKLIGDDEHGWTADHTIFNFEGGCYAKTVDLTEEKEPDIFHAIRRPALLENVGFFPGTVDVNYADRSITENTRVSYPIDHIRHIAVPSMGKNPKNIFFLTCDAYGVLPPISRLTPGQAAFHFISGYTAKVAGTETGVTEPTMTFSACFGAPFMPLHPATYAKMLANRMKAGEVTVWLVNTGWTGGPYGTGQRIKLSYTRNLITAALRGALETVGYEKDSFFGVEIPLQCDGVPTELLNPAATWTDRQAYEQKARFLAEAFLNNFKQYASEATAEMLAGAPSLPVMQEH